ncbi:DUF4232 domain-containing protein [Streptomyces sp. NBC_01335]|uniref:DUF4232 domain-containing protein n=1 Tax=Streptomyces sp. NBC_01335 TaxID=2903828 RepID=UPI002E10AACE|nr:DUF4232 domain-containing protein [Streptomyces sp. NBC_01335]
MRQLRTRRITRTSVFGVAALIGALSLTACSEEDRATIDRAIASSPAVTDGGAPLPDPAATGAATTDGTTATQANTSASAGSSGSSGSKSSGSKSSGSTSGSGKSSGSGTSGSGSSSTGSSGGSSAGSSGSSSDDDAPNYPSCDGTNSKVKGSILSRPINHVLLTVTNTGSTTCNAVGYPGIGYEGAQAVMAYDENSVPQAVIALEPGQSAYASVRTSAADGSGEGGFNVKALRVSFQDNQGGFNDGQVTVPLSKAVWIDSSAVVTYWQSDFETATSF